MLYLSITSHNTITTNLCNIKPSSHLPRSGVSHLPDNSATIYCCVLFSQVASGLKSYNTALKMCKPGLCILVLIDHLREMHEIAELN